jgi:RecA-family ATPase
MNESPEDFLKRGGFTELPSGEFNDEIPWPDNDKEAPPPALEALDVGTDDQPIPPRRWLLGNVFCREFVSGVIASGAGCKTSLRLVQALSVSSGKSLTGEYVFVRANVLIVCLEDGMTELRRRIRAAMKHHGIAREEVKGRLFLTTPTGMKMAQYSRKGSVVVRGDLDRAIRTFIDERKIDLVIIDPIKKAHSVEENDNNDMDAVVTILARLAIEKNIAVDVLSHEKKTSGEAGDANRARGAGAMKAGD